MTSKYEKCNDGISVRVVWEEEMGGYVAYDDMFDWYGVGDNVNMALRHLAEVIVEDYEDLEQNAERLFPNLREKLELMRRVLVLPVKHADLHKMLMGKLKAAVAQ